MTVHEQLLCVNTNHQVPLLSRKKSHTFLIKKRLFFEQGFDLISIGLRAYSLLLSEYNSLFAYHLII